jgi:hypothetical protein
LRCRGLAQTLLKRLRQIELLSPSNRLEHSHPGRVAGWADTEPMRALWTFLLLLA